MPAEPFAVIFPAAGRSTRFGDPRGKKVYADLGGRAVWQRAVAPFAGRDDVAQLILAIAAEDRELFEDRYAEDAKSWNLRVIIGGAERAETIARALAVLELSCRYVAVHDAARPCVTPDLIDAVFDAARRHGAAVPGLAVADTLKRVDADEMIVETVPRRGLFAVQTPQAFRRELLERAYQQRADVADPTDCARLVEALGEPVRIVEGSARNLKITEAEDLRLASMILESI